MEHVYKKALFDVRISFRTIHVANLLSVLPPRIMYFAIAHRFQNSGSTLNLLYFKAKKCQINQAIQP